MNRRGYGDLTMDASTARVTLFGFDEERQWRYRGVEHLNHFKFQDISNIYRSKKATVLMDFSEEGDSTF